MGFVNTFFKFCSELDNFEISTVIDVAADGPKIDGNEFRNIFYNEIKNIRRIGEFEFDTRDFSVTNLEGKNLAWNKIHLINIKKHTYTYITLMLNHC